MNINSSLIRIVRVLVCSDSADAVDSTAASSRLRRRRRRRWRPAGTADCSSTSADCRLNPPLLVVRNERSCRSAAATPTDRHQQQHRRAVVSRSSLLRYDIIYRRADRQVRHDGARLSTPPYSYNYYVTHWDYCVSYFVTLWAPSMWVVWSELRRRSAVNVTSRHVFDFVITNAAGLFDLTHQLVV